jgi:hypothetical protein
MEQAYRVYGNMINKCTCMAENFEEKGRAYLKGLWAWGG